MKAVMMAPGTAGSVRVEDVPEPDAALGSVVVEALAVGICGTDAEIASGGYGWAPPGRDRLILGHESLGRVIDLGTAGSKPALVKQLGATYHTGATRANPRILWSVRRPRRQAES